VLIVAERLPDHLIMQMVGHRHHYDSARLQAGNPLPVEIGLGNVGRLFGKPTA